MDNTFYKLIFQGKIQPGFKEKEVRKNLQSLLKVDQSKMRRLFSGNPIVLRKNLPETTIRHYEKALAKAGAQCRIISVAGDVELPPVYPEVTLSTSEDVPPISPPKDKRETSLFQRLGRIRFIALCWLVLLTALTAWWLPDKLYSPLSILHRGQIPLAQAGLATLAGLILVLITALRLHDMNQRAWLSLFLAIPGLNLLFILWLSIARGSHEANGFGPQPSEAGNLARVFGLWLPLMLSISAAGYGWLYQDQLQQLASHFPDTVIQWDILGLEE